jgi:hypothetical protein
MAHHDPSSPDARADRRGTHFARPAGSSRRAFLAGAGVTTVAAAGVGLPFAAPAAADHGTAADPGNAQAVVAYLRDPARGEIRLMAGEREVVVHDVALARALTRHLSRRQG